MAISREISSVFWPLRLLPEQGKDFCDRHHALELCRSVAGPLRSVDNSFNGLSGLGRASFDPTSYVAEHQPERGRIMAKGKKRAKVQKRGKLPKGKTASRGKARKVAKAAKRTVARAKPKHAPVKKAAQKVKQPVTPVVETVAVEMIEQPAPGVITVTEVEETRRAS
jgi:hypothetical protein